MSPATNSLGKVTAVTVLTPIKRRWVPWLRFLFRAAHVLPLTRWTLLRLRLIHFARWALITGPRRPHLLFESNFNGSFDAYIDAFAYVFPRGMWLIWGGSERWPGTVPTAPFKDWIRDHGLDVVHYYAAYPEASTKTVLAALETRKHVDALAARTGRLSPTDFRRDYDRLLVDLQRHI